MDKVYQALNKLDSYLATEGKAQSYLAFAEARLRISRRSLVLGVVGLLVWLLFGLLAPVVVSIVSFAYPALQSVRAVETNANWGKWLSYWIIFASFTMFESITAPMKMLNAIPFYFTAKLLFLIWCMAPIDLNGSKIIYKLLLRNVFAGFIDDVPVDNRFNEIRNTESKSTRSTASYLSSAYNRAYASDLSEYEN